MGIAMVIAEVVPRHIARGHASFPGFADPRVYVLENVITRRSCCLIGGGLWSAGRDMCEGSRVQDDLVRLVDGTFL